jgi:selenocysteine-specific translation elongation factor
MDHSTVALIGPGDWASSIGKETSNTSFSVRALKKDDRIITVLYPSKYPEKIWSLLFSLSLTDTVLLKVEKIDKDLGETIIALDLAGIENGFLHVSDMVDRSMFSSLIKGTAVEKWREMDPDPNILRESILDMSNKWPQSPDSVVIDQAFPVKGVGTVALGFVIGGSIKKHQDLLTFPGGKRTQIRSIQIHDRDHSVATAGARVGLALKNIDPEDLPRGCLLSVEGSGIEKREVLDLKLKVSDYWKEGIEEGARMHLWSSLQFVPVTIEKVLDEEKMKVRVKPEFQVWVSPFSRFGLAHLDSKSFRLFAVGETI